MNPKLDLIELYEPMIKSIIKKYLGYANKVGLDYDDLFQEASIAVLRAENTYKNNKNMKLETWVYNNVEWQLQRALEKNNKYKNITSLQTNLNESEGDNITLEDTLQDNTNIESEIENKIMMDYYLKECERILPTDKFDVCYLKWFKGCSNTYIAETTNRKSINDVLRQSRSLLLTRSRVLNAEYRKMVGITDYNTQRIALI